jgi:sulfite reductase beta subunit-like hemoprotein
MYRYDRFDQRIVDERVAQFRDRTRRYLASALTEDEFRPLRLQNGLAELARSAVTGATRDRVHTSPRDA